MPRLRARARLGALLIGLVVSCGATVALGQTSPAADAAAPGVDESVPAPEAPSILFVAPGHRSTFHQVVRNLEATGYAHTAVDQRSLGDLEALADASLSSAEGRKRILEHYGLSVLIVGRNEDEMLRGRPAGRVLHLTIYDRDGEKLTAWQFHGKTTTLLGVTLDEDLPEALRELLE